MEIPEINFEENKVVLPTWEIPIIFNKEEKMIKLKQLTSGERREALKKHITSNIRGSQVTGNIQDPIGIQISFLSKIIVEAPFDFSEKGLDELPEGVIDYIYSEYERLFKKKQTSVEK